MGRAAGQARVLGFQPQTGYEVTVRAGPVGHYVQLGGNLTHEHLQQQAMAKPPPDVPKLKLAHLQQSSDLHRNELVRRLQRWVD